MRTVLSILSANITLCFVLFSASSCNDEEPVTDRVREPIELRPPSVYINLALQDTTLVFESAPGPSGESQEAATSIYEAATRSLFSDERVKTYVSRNTFFYLVFHRLRDPPPGFIDRLADLGREFKPLSTCDDYPFRCKPGIWFDGIAWYGDNKAGVTAHAADSETSRSVYLIAKWVDDAWWTAIRELSPGPW